MSAKKKKTKKQPKGFMSLFDATKPAFDTAKQVTDSLGRVPQQAQARAKNDQTRNRNAFQRELRQKKPEEMTAFDKNFLATKGGKKSIQPGHNWDNPAESNLDWIKRNATKGKELQQKEAAVQTPKIDVQASLANAEAARQVREMQGGGVTRANANGQPVAYRGGVPVGFAGAAPGNDVLGADADMRSMINREGLFGAGERAAIGKQAQDVANMPAAKGVPSGGQSLGQMFAEQPTMQGEMPPAFQSAGMPVVSDPGPQEIPSDAAMLQSFASGGEQQEPSLAGFAPAANAQPQFSDPNAPGYVDRKKQNPYTTGPYEWGYDIPTDLSRLLNKFGVGPGMRAF